MFRPSAILALLLAAALVAPPQRASAISCMTVYSSLYPCLGYFQGSGMIAPSSDCCDGIRSVVSMARAANDRRSTCGCLKSEAAGVSAANIALAGALPAKCGVSVPYKISPSTDCANDELKRSNEDGVISWDGING